MSRNNAGNDAGFALLALAGVVALIVWKFSTTFGLDFATGASVLTRLVIWAVTLAGAWWLGRESGMFGPGLVLPVALALLWVCGWPALDYWATQEYPSFYQPGDVSVWYDAWYTKAGGAVVALAGGYGLKALWTAFWDSRG